MARPAIPEGQRVKEDRLRSAGGPEQLDRVRIAQAKIGRVEIAHHRLELGACPDVAAPGGFTGDGPVAGAQLSVGRRTLERDRIPGVGAPKLLPVPQHPRIIDAVDPVHVPGAVRSLGPADELG
jgi:hypothetical protein